jgi:hypothetical protein
MSFIKGVRNNQCAPPLSHIYICVELSFKQKKKKLSGRWPQQQDAPSSPYANAPAI